AARPGGRPRKAAAGGATASTCPRPARRARATGRAGRSRNVTSSVLWPGSTRPLAPAPSAGAAAAASTARPAAAARAGARGIPGGLGLPALRLHPWYRHPAIPAQGARRRLDAHRPLAALVLSAVHHADDLGGELTRDAAPGEVVGVEVVLDVALEDRVEHVVWRQRIGVELARTKLGRRRPVDRVARDHLAPLGLVPPAGEPVDPGLVDVA